MLLNAVLHSNMMRSEMDATRGDREGKREERERERERERKREKDSGRRASSLETAQTALSRELN